jgi:Mor family transcriptional regulator
MSSLPKRTKVFKSVWYDRLVVTIGLEATRRLLAKYGGKTIKLPKIDAIHHGSRNVLITRDYRSKQYNKKELVEKWGLSYPTILKAIKDTVNDPRYKDEFN